MANSVFDPEKILGDKIVNMDQQELCEFVSALCRAVAADTDSTGVHGGIYPDNISVDENGGIAVGAPGESPWDIRELNFISPEQYWNGSVSGASDVYSVGMLMYYAVSGGKLPFEEDGDNAQPRRMDGGDVSAPAEAEEELGGIIEKCLRFSADERWQSLDELRKAMDGCVKNMYLSDEEDGEDEEAEAEPDEFERMVIGMKEGEEPAADEEDPEDDDSECVKVYTPAPKTGPKEIISQDQSDLLAQKFETAGSPAAPKFIVDIDDLEPVIINKRGDDGAEPGYVRGTERERKIAEEVRKRRRRPLAVILVLCAVLVMAAIVMNAMLKDFQEARNRPDNVIDTIEVDPYAATFEPVASPVNTGAIGIEDLELNEDGIPTAGHDETKDPVLSTTTEQQGGEADKPVEHGYQVFKADVSWTQAQKACNDLGGHLVVISDEQEYDAIVQLAEEAGITRVWIGCHRINGEDKWENGEPGYVKWAKGEPTFVDTNDKVAEDYFMLWNNRGWACNDNRDDPCADYPEFYSGTMGYICEFGD